jgi:hypothetical protein
MDTLSLSCSTLTRWMSHWMILSVDAFHQRMSVLKCTELCERQSPGAWANISLWLTKWGIENMNLYLQVDEGQCASEWICGYLWKLFVGPLPMRKTNTFRHCPHVFFCQLSSISDVKVLKWGRYFSGGSNVNFKDAIIMNRNTHWKMGPSATAER